MARLDNTQFLAQVEKLLAGNDGNKSVYLTQKRLALDVEQPEPFHDLSSNVVPSGKYPENTTKYPVLIRVNTTKNDKISTVVEVDRLDQFWGEYVQVLKSGFVGLKKERKDKKKKRRVQK